MKKREIASALDILNIIVRVSTLNPAEATLALKLLTKTKEKNLKKRMFFLRNPCKM